MKHANAMRIALRPAYAHTNERTNVLDPKQRWYRHFHYLTPKGSIR